MSSIFTKILNGEIPSEILYETSTVFVIRDINPEDKTHLLIIPKEEIASLNDINKNNEKIMLEIILAAQHMDRKL
jgi:histidine triad (HIT) family protein